LARTTVEAGIAPTLRPTAGATRRPPARRAAETRSVRASIAAFAGREPNRLSLPKT